MQWDRFKKVFLSKRVDDSNWKNPPHFNIEHQMFESLVFFTVFIQIGVCIFIMLYLTINHEVSEYWKYVYYLERLENIMGN